MRAIAVTRGRVSLVIAGIDAGFSAGFGIDLTERVGGTDANVLVGICKGLQQCGHRHEAASAGSEIAEDGQCVGTVPIIGVGGRYQREDGRNSCFWRHMNGA